MTETAFISILGFLLAGTVIFVFVVGVYFMVVIRLFGWKETVGRDKEERRELLSRHFKRAAKIAAAFVFITFAIEVFIPMAKLIF